jgi:6-pyruvoyltetrahydropterin/6-carboxytetrahydropterin synthase
LLLAIGIFARTHRDPMKTAVYRKVHFNAAHRLNNPQWSAEKNAETFGKCNYPNYHGHNYELIVGLIGEVDPGTGYVIDLGDLKAILEEEVLEPFDHRNLNLDVPDFKDLNPSAENIAKVIYDKLRKRIEESLEIEVTLYETPRNFVKYPIK